MVAKAAGVPRLERAVVSVVWVTLTRRVPDEDNLITMLKPALDGIVDAGVLQDDSAKSLRYGTVLFRVERGGTPRVIIQIKEDTHGRKAKLIFDAAILRWRDPVTGRMIAVPKDQRICGPSPTGNHRWMISPDAIVGHHSPKEYSGKCKYCGAEKTFTEVNCYGRGKRVP